MTTVVRAAEAAGEGIRRLILMDPDGWELPPFAAGGHVDVHLPGGHVRSYSLCNDPIDSTRYVIAVKREPHGRGGSLVLHDRVSVGDVLGVSLPRRGLTLVDGAKRHVFVAGGIGITPFLSLAATLRRAGAEFILHLCARGEPPLRASVEPLATSGRAVFHDTRAGRPDLAALIGSPDPETQLYCCGPRGMIAAFEEAAMRAGWPQGQTHVEHFVPLPTEHDGPRYAIVLARCVRSAWRSTPHVRAGSVARAVCAGSKVRQSIAIACCRRPNESGTSWSASRAAPARGSSSTCEPFGAGLIDNHKEARFGFCVIATL